MKITILPGAGTVTIDGRTVAVSLDHLKQSIASVQWFGSAGVIEMTERAFVGTEEEGPICTQIKSLDQFRAELDTAEAALDAIDNPPPASLPELKVAAAMAVDARAELARQKFMTPGDIKAFVYGEKLTEARAFGADSDPDPEDYPLIHREIGLTGESAAEVAGVVLGRHGKTIIALADIEVAQIAAKRAISAAEDADAVAAVLSGLTWPQPQ